jgi:hypothetical protein
MSATKPRVLVVHYTYTQQTLEVAEAMVDALVERGCDGGGEYVSGVHFTFAGRQVRSLLALLSYLGKGENVERYLGVKIPASNLQPGYQEQARAFANELADGLKRRGSERVRAPSPMVAEAHAGMGG